MKLYINFLSLLSVDNCNREAIIGYDIVAKSTIQEEWWSFLPHQLPQFARKEVNWT